MAAPAMSTPPAYVRVTLKQSSRKEDRGCEATEVGLMSSTVCVCNRGYHVRAVDQADRV